MESKGNMAAAHAEPAPQDSVVHAFDLFVVHAADDADFVRGYLLPALDLPSARVLLVDELTPGALVVSELDRGVSRSRFTVVVLSPAYLEDRWAMLGEQLASYVSIQDAHVIPLRLIDCKLPLRLEARVALDFTDRATWESEAARLRELLHTTGAPPVLADLRDHPRAVRPRGATTPRKLELVDASFDDNESSCPVLDLKIINRSTSSVVVKRVDIHILTAWKLPKKLPNIVWRVASSMTPSASYDLLIPDFTMPDFKNPDSAPPFVLSQQVSHVLKPDEADRFRIAFHGPALGDVVLSMIAKVVQGSESSQESSGELLCAFVSHYDEWDADAQRICVQLAREIRTRKGRMSKRLLALLEEMEAGSRKRHPEWEG